jgi:hypothetical protein
MDSKKTLSRNGLILLLVGQVFCVILCIWYIQHVYNRDILPDKQVNKTYQTTDCTVLDKALRNKHRLFPYFRAEFYLGFTVNDKSYKEWIGANGLDASYSTDAMSQQTLLNQFTVGNTYPCWFNPKAPEQVVLVLRHRWESTFHLFVPAIIILLAGYSGMQTLIRLLNLRRKSVKG